MIADAHQTGATVLTAVDQQADTAAERLAVQGPDGSLTYGELSRRADALAARLHQVGVQPGDLVGLFVERSAGLVVAALGILRAGATYLALDPAYPDERVRWMLEDSGAAAVLTDAGTAARPEARGERPHLVVEAAGELTGGQRESGHRPLPQTPFRDRAESSTPLATDPAYVVYTSGSTGRPKGVLVAHAALANLVQWHRSAFALTPDDRCTQIASPGFDAAVWEIWPSLASGAALLVVPDELRNDPIALRDWLVAKAITVTFLPTVLAEAVVGLSWPSESALRYLLTGGDALTHRPPAGLPFSLVNNYGLSETAVVATSGPVAAGGEGAPSIGRPIDGVLTRIVDERSAPVPAGLPGELMVGGVAVAQGYLNRLELTAKRFLADGQARWYRTGDRVRERPDGELEFLGRLDAQLSIRGFRVEPGEIGATLDSHPAIQASVTVPRGDSAAERELVSYVVAAGAERPDDAELAAFLAQRLPEYMVPSRYAWMDRLPLTAHGKIDHTALPALEPAGVDSEGIRPKTAIQAATASIVAELLDAPTIGMDQNFFLLGGHSMLGAQLIVRLEDRFGVEISLRYLFDHPTLAEIAEEVERQSTGAPADALVGR